MATFPRSRSLWITLTGFAVVVFLLLHRLQVLRPVEQAFGALLRPLQGFAATGASRLRDIFQDAGSTTALKRENVALRKQLEQLLIEKEEQRLSSAEAARVEAAQRLLGERSLQGTIARVIGRAPDPSFRVHILNRGEKEGVRLGAAVIAGEGIYIGKIIEVDRNTSKLLLLTDPHATAAAYVENPAQTQGLLSGEHGLALRLDLLAKDDVIELDQLVVTSGIEPGVPRGLIAGRVGRVTNLPGELFQSASVEPAADLRSLNVVTILVNDHA